MRKRDVARILVAVLFLLLGVLLASSIGWYRAVEKIPRENQIGNRISNISRLKEKGFPYSFLVVGDTHSSYVAHRLLQKASKEGHSSFMVILGDVVSKPYLWNHRFFLMEMLEGVKPPFPVFLVPGNHDIDYVDMKGSQEARVTPGVYESLYGSRNFDFVFNDCLFVISGVDGKNPTGYLTYLKDTLARKSGGKKHIFIFLHHPPKDVGMPASFALPGEEEFFTLLEAYKVTACFFGDYHAYWRTQRKGTNLIVSGGGGGALKKWQPEWGKFHHLLKITVDQDRIGEEIMVLKGKENDLFWTLKRWIFLRLFPSIGNRGWLLYIFTVLSFSLGFYFAFMFSRRFLKAGRSGGGEVR